MAVKWKDADGTVATVSELQGKNRVRYSVVFTYKVNEGWYGGTFTSYDPLTVGDSLAVRYDPENPDHNDLVEKEKWRKIFGIGLAVIAGVLWLFFANR